MKVKVWIAHTGENRNNCMFSKEVLESMIPSLANIPILGYIGMNEDTNEIDFKGHEEGLVIENNQFKMKYFGRAYGLIPENNNARFEFRYGEDGLEREYLVCDGLIWRKFPEVEQIFDRDGGFKSQSMELDQDSAEGYLNDNGVFVFTQARFEGACLLGEDVSPAMISSTIERFSVNNKVQNELSEMLNEFNTYFSTIEKKGVDNVENEKLNVEGNPETEFAKKDKEKDEKEKNDSNSKTTEEPKKEEGSNAKEGSNTDESTKESKDKEDDKSKEKESSKEKDSEEDEDKNDKKKFAVKDEEEDEDKDKDKEKEKETKKEDDEEEDKKPKKFTRTFELSHDDIRASLFSALDKHESFENKWFWITQVYDSHALVHNEEENKFFKVNYVKHEDAVSIGDTEELFPTFLSASEKQAVDSSRNNFSALEEEVQELRQFKENIVLKDKEKKLTEFASRLSQEEYKSIKDNLTKFSMDDIEKEIAVMLLRKDRFSVQGEVETAQTRVSATDATESNPYGSASVYFTK